MNRPIIPATIRAPLARYSHAMLVPPGAQLLVTSGQLGVAATDLWGRAVALRRW
jgi:enamine deaminase RidA (YjgF/YER057c/UK114 family)